VRDFLTVWWRYYLGLVVGAGWVYLLGWCKP
jgi:hypothetical protein